MGKVSCVTKGRNVEYGLWNMDYDMENVEWEIQSEELGLGMENGKEQIKNRKWKMESGK